MKKFVLLCAVLCAAVCLLGGCREKVDYLSYISEKRTNIYLYSNDGLEIKIYLSEKENPYSADGIKGEMNALTEVFVTLPKNCDEVEVSLGNTGGEMNYRAVENCYYLNLSNAEISGESVDVTLAYDGESKAYSAVSVLTGGVIGCDGAVKCVIEREGELFENLTQNNIFCGEIYVRLLYDDGCYYYVGICDRDKNINAYLVDGERGKIIATKQMNG